MARGSYPLPALDGHELKAMEARERAERSSTRDAWMAEVSHPLHSGPSADLGEVKDVEVDWGVPEKPLHRRLDRESGAIDIQRLVRGWLSRKEAKKMRSMAERMRWMAESERHKQGAEHRAFMERLCAEEEARRRKRVPSKRRGKVLTTEEIRAHQKRYMLIRERAFKRKGHSAIAVFQERVRAWVQARREAKEAELASRAALQAIREASSTSTGEYFSSTSSSSLHPPPPPRRPIKSAPSYLPTAVPEAAHEDALSSSPELDDIVDLSTPEERFKAERAASVVAAIFRGKAIREKLRRVRRVAWRAKLRVPNRERLIRLFRSIDESGDGLISAQEWLRASMKGATGDDVNQWEWYNPSDDEEEEEEEEMVDESVSVSSDEGRGGGEGGSHPPTIVRAATTPVEGGSGSGIAPPPTSRSTSFLSNILGPRGNRGSKLQLSADKHMRVFRAIDNDESGEIDEEEFVNFFLATRDDAMKDWMQSKLVELLEPETWATEEHKERAKVLMKQRRLEAAHRAVRTQYWRECARKLFDLADTDNSGDITPLELRRVLASGPADDPVTADPDRALRLFRLFDADHSGSIEEDELISVFGNESILPLDLRAWLERFFGPPPRE